MENLFSAPQDLESHETTTRSVTNYGGIQRLPFFLAAIGNGLVCFFILIQLAPLRILPLYVLCVLVFLGIHLYILGNRIRNIGYSPYWALLMLVPCANYVVAIGCFACPEGYAQTKKLDIAGTIIVILGILSFFSHIVRVLNEMPN